MKAKKLKKLIRFWGPPFIWVVVIFLFSTLSTKPVSKIYWREFAVKKSAHMVEYGILSLLLYRALINSGVKKKWSLVIPIVFSLLYGISDEFHQSFVPGREPKVRDVVFDTIGSVLVILYIWKLLPKAPKRLRNWARELQIK